MDSQQWESFCVLNSSMAERLLYTGSSPVWGFPLLENIRKNLLWKKATTILIIRKCERDALLNNGWDKYVKSNHVKHTTKTYYIVENPDALQFLEDFREYIRVK